MLAAQSYNRALQLFHLLVTLHCLLDLLLLLGQSLDGNQLALILLFVHINLFVQVSDLLFHCFDFHGGFLVLHINGIQLPLQLMSELLGSEILQFLF